MEYKFINKFRGVKFSLKGKLKPVEYHLKLKDLPADCRPQERLFAKGPEALSNAELLALIIRTGNLQETALDLSNRLLTRGGLKFLAEISIGDLKEFKGIGEAKYAQIKALVELCKRMSSITEDIRPCVRSPQDVVNLMMEEMRFLDREHFRALILNTKNQVLCIDKVSVGSLNSSLVHPRELFKEAIRRSAAALILVHNHPSGDPTPSREDTEVTKRLVQAGEIIGINVLDHVVVGNGRWISLKEKGLM